MVVSSQIDVQQSYIFKDFFTALTSKNVDVFSDNMIFYLVVICLSLPMSIATRRLEAIVLLRWRGWTTGYFMKVYLSDKKYYKMILDNNNADARSNSKSDKSDSNDNSKIDNPD